MLKLSTFHRRQGWHVVLSRARDGARPAARLDADKHLASVVFRTPVAARAVEQLQALYGDRIEFGGSGGDLGKRLPPEVASCFPDYSLYDHKLYALGFLTMARTGKSTCAGSIRSTFSATGNTNGR